jgi:hypothetical protein
VSCITANGPIHLGGESGSPDPALVTDTLGGACRRLEIAVSTSASHRAARLPGPCRFLKPAGRPRSAAQYSSSHSQVILGADLLDHRERLSSSVIPGTW